MGTYQDEIPRRFVAAFPPVPLTLEGSSVLHQFFRFDWKAWHATSVAQKERIGTGAAEFFTQWSGAR